MTSPRTILASDILMFAITVAGSVAATAAINTWQGGVTSDFNTPANWSLGALATSDVSTFEGLATVQPNLSSSLTVAQVNFKAGSTNYVISATGGAALTLTTSPVIFAQQTWGTNTVSADVVLSGGGTKLIQQAGPGMLWISGDISESTPGTAVRYERISSAGGRYLITGQNTYSGDTAFYDGTFTVTSFGNEGDPGSVGTSGTIWLANPTADSSRDATLVYAGPGETTDKTITVSAGSGARTISTQGATGPLILNNFAVTRTPALPKLTFSGDSLGNVLHGLIPDPSASTVTSVTKGGTGTWTFTANNTYTGTTTINSSGGTLLIDGDQSAATGAVTVGASGTLGGSGVVGGATSVLLNGILSPGGSPGTLTFGGDLALNNGAKCIVEPGDVVAVQGQLTLVNNWNLKLSGNFRDGGSVPIFTYGTLGASPDLAPTFDVSSLGFVPSTTLSLTDTGSGIVLNGLSLPPSAATVLTIR